MSGETNGSVFQIGIVVSDLEQAMEELAAATGLTWGEVLNSQLAEWSYRLAFSREGPPHIELIEAPPGSPWEPEPDGQMRIDHLQWWSADVEADTDRIVEGGSRLEVDGIGTWGRPFRYFRLQRGLRIELLADPEGDMRKDYRRRWRIE